MRPRHWPLQHHRVRGSWEWQSFIDLVGSVYLGQALHPLHEIGSQIISKMPKLCSLFPDPRVVFEREAYTTGMFKFTYKDRGRARGNLDQGITLRGSSAPPPARPGTLLTPR